MRHRLGVALGVALFGISCSALALTDTETNASIPFNLATPGARSMGMGGAFLGLADDATAAYSNPAGLTQLVSPEISVEARHTEYSIPYVNSGSVSLSPFDGSGLNTANADSSRNNLSFLSAVLPHDRWSFAFYRDELVRFNDNFSSGDSAGGGVLIGDLFETYPVSARANLKIVDYGVSAAWKAGDNISLGAGLSYYDFNIDTLVTRRTFEGAIDGVAAGTPLNQQSQKGSDNDVGLNLGARIIFNDQLSAGLVYRRGPSFTYRAQSVLLPLFSGDETVVASDLTNVRFKIPDQFGAGLSWHPSDALVVNFDADYIEYSQLTRGIQSLFGSDVSTVSKLSINNGTELHLGAEYTFVQFQHPFSLRAGVWHDPRHSIQFEGDPGTDLQPTALAALFAGGKGSQTHASVGAGFAFKKFQIDAAADFSDLTDVVSVSAVYRF
ncbi:MAG: outer membrane protein transport protein [Rudaea sp.]